MATEEGSSTSGKIVFTIWAIALVVGLFGFLSSAIASMLLEKKPDKVEEKKKADKAAAAFGYTALAAVCIAVVYGVGVYAKDKYDARTAGGANKFYYTF